MWDLCIYCRLQLRCLIEVKFISKQSKLSGHARLIVKDQRGTLWGQNAYGLASECYQGGGKKAC